MIVSRLFTCGASRWKEIQFLGRLFVYFFVPLVFPLLCSFPRIHFDHLLTFASSYIIILITIPSTETMIVILTYKFKSCGEKVARNAQDESTVEKRPITIVTVFCQVKACDPDGFDVMA